jgi:hypothetical protein
VADVVRYYAALDVERGENHLRADFEESRLPTVYRFRTLRDSLVRATREGSYFFYDGNGERVDHSAALGIVVDVQPAGADSIAADLAWSLEIDGAPVTEDSRTIARAADDPEWLRDEFEIFADEYHRYFVRIRAQQETVHLEILAAFLSPAASPGDGRE